MKSPFSDDASPISSSKYGFGTAIAAWTYSRFREQLYCSSTKRRSRDKFPEFRDHYGGLQSRVRERWRELFTRARFLD
jgi:hypothetical protein